MLIIWIIKKVTCCENSTYFIDLKAIFLDLMGRLISYTNCYFSFVDLVHPVTCNNCYLYNKNLLWHLHETLKTFLVKNGV